MKRALVAAALLALVPACKKERPAAPVDDSAEAIPAADGPYEISSDKLDRYIKYYAKMNELFPAIIRDVDAFDGGSDAIDRVKKKAEAEEKARAEAGLDQHDLDEMDRIVQDIVNKRMVAKGITDDSMLAQMEAMRAQLAKDPEARAAADKAIADAKKLRDDMKNLVEERQRYGDKNVDLVLTREADLLKLWDARFSALGGKSP